MNIYISFDRDIFLDQSLKSLNLWLSLNDKLIKEYK